MPMPARSTPRRVTPGRAAGPAKLKGSRSVMPPVVAGNGEWTVDARSQFPGFRNRRPRRRKRHLAALGDDGGRRPRLSHGPLADAIARPPLQHVEMDVLVVIGVRAGP